MNKVSSMSELLSLFNKERKVNKNQWFICHFETPLHYIDLKAYNTWIQVLTITDKSDNALLLRDGSVCEQTVKACNTWLERTIKSIIKLV